MIDWPETRLRFNLWLMQSWLLRVPAWLLLSKHVPESEDFGEFGDNQEPCSTVQATVFALIPEFNQVRVESSDGRQYAITAKTVGVDFDELQVGQRLQLTVDDRGRVLHAALIGDKKYVLYLPANSGVFDPKNDHLFTAEAAHKSFEHLKADVGDRNRTDEHGKCVSPNGNTLPLSSKLGDSEIEPLTPEQHAVIAKAEPITRGKVIYSVLPDDDFEPLTAAQQAVIVKAESMERGKVIDSLLPDDAEEFKNVEAQRIERWKTILAVSAGAAGVIGFLIAMAGLFFAR